MSEWRELFSEAIVNAGDAAVGSLWRADQISDYKSSCCQITGTVYGKYHVRILKYRDEIVEMKCNCEYSKKHPCKHMAAVLIKNEVRTSVDASFDHYSRLEEEEENDFFKFVKRVDECWEEMLKALEDEPLDKSIDNWQAIQIQLDRLTNQKYSDDKKEIADKYIKKIAEILSFQSYSVRYALYLFEKLEKYKGNYYIAGKEFQELKQSCLDRIKNIARLGSMSDQEELFAWIYKRINRYNKMEEALLFTDLFYEYFTDKRFLVPKVIMTQNYIEIESHLAMEEPNGRDFTGVYVLPCLELMIAAGYSVQEQDALALEYLHIPSVKEWYEEQKGKPVRTVKRPLMETLRLSRSRVNE